MSDAREESVKFTVIPPKRETRSSQKRRITFDTKDASPRRQHATRPTIDKPDFVREEKERKTKQKPTKALAPLDDEADNQGFSEWLRSDGGVDTMRLFVLANSLLVFVTMAWPYMQQTFAILREAIFGEEEDY